jgi:hypothetical protein
VRDPFPRALDRPRAPLGQRLQIRGGNRLTLNRTAGRRDLVTGRQKSVT